jgi:hypothetical protein
MNAGMNGSLDRRAGRDADRTGGQCDEQHDPSHPLIFTVDLRGATLTSMTCDA